MRQRNEMLVNEAQGYAGWTHALGQLFASSLAGSHGFSELWFDDLEALQRALASPEAQAALADSVNFVDAQRVQTREQGSDWHSPVAPKIWLYGQ